MAQRLAEGRVRECHGDLHLGNVAVIDGHSTAFDAIDFNDDFRWIDVISEVAFLATDLQAHGLPALAHRFINGYLEQCGDYGGVALLSYYAVHRALVRAKVSLLRATQRPPGQAAAAAADRSAARRCIDVALQACRGAPASPVLMLTHGFSGSGKSTGAQSLVEAAGAIRLRADVERKRLAGLAPQDRAGAAPGAGDAAQDGPALYTPAMTATTYACIAQLAEPVLQSGRHAILDATFLQRGQRDAARKLAARLGVPCVILDFVADTELLRQRLRDRARLNLDPSDADEAVLAAQMHSDEPLQADEQALMVRWQPTASATLGAANSDWTALLQRLGATGQAAPPQATGAA